MKQQLFEYLVRHCVREVLAQKKLMEAEDPTLGAPAPPAAGQGTAEQPPVPDAKDTTPEPPSEPETPVVKGLVFINPVDKSKVERVNINGRDEKSIKVELETFAKKHGAILSSGVVQMAKQAVTTPNVSIYLYLKKYDPNSSEVFLVADKSRQVAKDNSVDTSIAMTLPTPPTAPVTPTVPPVAPAAPAPRLDEQTTKLIKRMVRNILNNK